MVGRLLPLNKEAGKSEQIKKKTTKAVKENWGRVVDKKSTENSKVSFLNSLKPDKMSPITDQARGSVTEQMWLHDWEIKDMALHKFLLSSDVSLIRKKIIIFIVCWNRLISTNSQHGSHQIFVVILHLHHIHMKQVHIHRIKGKMLLGIILAHTCWFSYLFQHHWFSTQNGQKPTLKYATWEPAMKGRNTNKYGKVVRSCCHSSQCLTVPQLM